MYIKRFLKTMKTNHVIMSSVNGEVLNCNLKLRKIQSLKAGMRNHHWKTMQFIFLHAMPGSTS